MTFLLAFALLLTASPAWAQASGVSQPFDWRQLVGVAINTVGVLGVVQFIKWALPRIPEKYGYVIPFIATAISPLLMSLQGTLATALGFQGFDFTPISAALSGTVAVAAHQVYKQAKQAKQGNTDPST